MQPRLVILTATLFMLLGAAAADAARVRAVHKGPHGRTKVVVHRAHPIRRPLPVVVVRPAPVVRVAPRLFLAPVFWTAAVVARPDRDHLAWQDTANLSQEEEWVDFTLNADARGEALYLEVEGGRVQFEFVEVVFENGDCQVVDLDQRTSGAGVYRLLDFADGRKVDHVRVLARARTESANVTLLLRK